MDLVEQLRAIDGSGYGAYRRIRGLHAVDGLALHIDHVQGDPFASPSRVRVVVPSSRAGFPAALWRGAARAVALRDFLARRFGAAAAAVATRRGSGRGGTIEMAVPGQEVLERTAVLLHADGAVEARFAVGLPARGRRVLGREAAALLCEDVPTIVRKSLCMDAVEAHDPWRHVETVEDARALRGQLRARGLVAFVGDGSVLPRRSGVDARPMVDGVVPFRAPDALAVTLDRPNAGPIRGMGLAAGVTLVVGGGFHGKSTLLSALGAGVHDHVPGDGREAVVTDATAQQIRAEDGRAVSAVDISAFIGTLPGGRSTASFSTEDASGSTSQAAAIVEAVEAGVRVLLMDEDTCATNFLIRDERMQRLIAAQDEPITPFVDRVRSLHDMLGVSTVLVAGGSGDYLEVADRVVAMQRYAAVDLTAEARAVARAVPTGRRSAGDASWVASGERRLRAGLGLDAGTGDLPRVRTRGVDGVQIGDAVIDLSAVSGLVDRGQLEAIARAVLWLAAEVPAGRAVRDAVEDVMAVVARDGLDALDGRRRGDLAAFRVQDLAAALNRLRCSAMERAALPVADAGGG